MKKINLMLMCAAAVLFVGCAKELDSNSAIEGVKMVEVTIDVKAQAGKAALVDGENVVWEVGDKITIVTDDGSAKKITSNSQGFTFTFTGSEASATGTFTGYIPDGTTPLYAIYPATDNFKTNKQNSVIGFDSFEIPTVQNAKKGGIDGKYLLSAGAVTGSDGVYAVTMESICSLVKIVVPSNLTNVTDITIKTALGQPVSGKVAPTADGTNLTALEYTPEVTLHSESGALEPGDYYVAVIPTIPNNNNILDAEINYGYSRIVFTRTDGKVFTKKVTDDYLPFEPNYIYYLNFAETDMSNLPLRTRTSVTCTIQAMADALAAGNHTTKEKKTTEDVTVTVDGLDFVLKSYVPKAGYTNGWYTDVSNGVVRVINYNAQGSTKKGGYAYIKVPVAYGDAKLVDVKFMTAANNGNFMLSYLFPQDKSQASVMGKTPSLTCPTTPGAAYYAFWSAHGDATDLWLASYSGGANTFNGDIVCSYEVKYKEPTTISDVSVENLGSASDYKF